MYPLRKVLVSTMLLAGLGLASMPAHATVTFNPGNHPQSDEDNILLKSGAIADPVFGTTNMGGITVGFFSTTDMLTEPAIAAHYGAEVRVIDMNGSGTAVIPVRR